MAVNVKLISSQLLSLAAISLTFMNVLAAVALYDRHVVAENGFFLGTLALSTFVLVGGASWLLWMRAYENSKPDTEEFALQTEKDTRMDDALAKQREEMQSSIDKIAQSADALKAENADLVQRLGEESKLRDEESCRATDAHNALERTQQSLAAAKQHSDALTRERDALKVTVDALEESAGKLAEVTHSNEVLETSLRDMRAVCDELRESFSALVEEKSALETRVEELSNAEEEAEADTAEVSVSLLTQQESYASLIESMTQEIEAHTTEKEALNATLSERAEEIEGLKLVVVDKSELSERLQKSFEEKSELCESLQKSFDEKTQLCERLEKSLDEKSEASERLQKSFEEKTQLSERLQKSLDEKIATEKSLQSRIDALTKDDDAEAKPVRDLQSKVSSLEAELLEQSKTVAELEGDLAHKVDAELELAKTLELSRAEVKSLQGRLLCETQSGGALKYAIAVKEETELTVTRDLEWAHSTIADLEQKLERESSRCAKVNAELFALKSESAHVSDMLRKCEERNSYLEEDLKELRDATQSQGAMGDQVKLALSTLQRRVTSTLTPPPLDRHTSAPALSPVRETVEPTDTTVAPRSPPKALSAGHRRHRSVDATPKNTPRKMSSGEMRSPSDYTVLLKSKARFKRALSMRSHSPVLLTPAHRRSLTHSSLFRPERSRSLPRAFLRRTVSSQSAPNSPLFGPAVGGFGRVGYVDEDDKLAVRLFPSDAAEFDLAAETSKRQRSEANKASSEFVPRSTYEELNARYEALSLQVSELQASTSKEKEDPAASNFDGTPTPTLKVEVAALKRASIASQSGGDLCNIDEVLRSPESAFSSRQPSPQALRLNGDRAEMLARDLAEARRTILDLQKRLSDMNASNLEVREEASTVDRSDLSREVDSLREQLAEESKKVADITESRHETEQRLKKITTLARALKTENTALSQRASVEVAALRAELGEREVTQVSVQRVLDEFAASEVQRKREARARVLAAGARFQSINTDSSKRTSPETPRSAPATFSLLADTPEKDAEGCGRRGEGEMTSGGNTPQKIDMHKSLILADGDDPAKDLFGDDDDEDADAEENAAAGGGDSPWKVAKSPGESNGESEADFEENASDTFSPVHLARARHQRALGGRAPAAAFGAGGAGAGGRRPSLASVASCPELPVASHAHATTGRHRAAECMSESGEAGANQPPFKMPDTPLRPKASDGGGGVNQCAVIRQLIAKFRKLCERLLQANDKLQEYESQHIETQCEMDALRDSSTHQVEQLRARLATLEKAYEQSIGEISQLRTAYRDAEAHRKQADADLAKLRRGAKAKRHRSASSASGTSTPRTPLPSPTDDSETAAASPDARTEVEVTPPSARASATSSGSTKRRRGKGGAKGSASTSKRKSTPKAATATSSLISPSATSSRLVRPRATSFTTSSSRSAVGAKSRTAGGGNSRLRTSSVDESRTSSKEKDSPPSADAANGEQIAKLTVEKEALERENKELHEKVMKSDERAADFEMERENLKMKHDADRRRLKEANAKIKQLREKIFHLEELEIVHLDKIEELETDITAARNVDLSQDQDDDVDQQGGRTEQDGVDHDQVDQGAARGRTQDDSFASNLVDSSFTSSCFDESFGGGASPATDQAHRSFASAATAAEHRQSLGNPEYSSELNASSFPVVVPDTEGYSANASSCVKNLSFSSVAGDETPDMPSRAHISLLSSPENSYSHIHSDRVRSERLTGPEGSSRAIEATPKHSSVALSVDVKSSATPLAVEHRGDCTTARHHRTTTEPKFPSPSSLNIENLRSLTAEDLAGPLPRFHGGGGRGGVSTPPRSAAHHRRVHSYAAPTSAPRRPPSMASMHRGRYAARTHDVSALTRTPGRPFASSRAAAEGGRRTHGLGLSHMRTHSSVNVGSYADTERRTLFHSHISPKDISRALATAEEEEAAEAQMSAGAGAGAGVNVPLERSSFASAVPPEKRDGSSPSSAEAAEFGTNFSPLANYRTF